MASLSAGSHSFFLKSPAELGKAQCFAVKRGETADRLDAKFHALHEILSSPFPLVEFGRLVCAEPDYGLSSRAVPRTSNKQPRYIRITDFGEDGIEPDHKFVTADPIVAGYKLNRGDIIFSRTGSVGKTYLHEDVSEPAVFAGYCIRFKFHISKVLPKFVYWWTKTQAYERWVTAIHRPSVQSNINKAEFKSCQIPLPKVEVQSKLVTKMNAARAERRAKLAEADALLAGIDDFLLDTLNITPPPEDHRRVFAVRSQVARKRFDPYFHSPNFARMKKMLSQTRCKPLGDIAAFSKETWSPRDRDQLTFRYIEISTVSPQTGEAHWNDVLTSEAPSRARMKVKANDIIVSLTRPHHGSIAYLGSEFEGCIASTGFAVIRNVAEHVRRDYLWCVLRAQFCLDQMLQRTSGGNYPAIIQSELLKILVPVPGEKTQNRIASEVRYRRENARRLRDEAENGWQAAKRWFEEQLLGSTTP